MRDYVSIQGFSLQVGKKVIVEVFRAGILTGQTIGIGGTAGGALLDVNHPGG